MTQPKLNNTFWKVISANEIIIPTIQRDYAYGRPEASTIVSKLLAEIKDALENPHSMPLHLAFVYGKLEGKQNDQVLLRNSENIKALLESVKEYAGNLDIIVDFDTKRDVVRLADNVKFIPIDGQQRLTTLFLIHWYLAVQLNKYGDLKVLRKFQYATRLSSKEFCNLICSIEPKEVQGELNSEFITNQEGYFKQWHNDPTVKNMLTVIDKVHETFKGSKSHFESYYQKLTKTDIICFDFFDLDNFQLTDELYVKMNSRGKKLTQFENFKAWLYAQVYLEQSVKTKIDIDWYDIFWQSQRGEPKDIDTAYLQWFKNLYLADYLKESSSQNRFGLEDTTNLEHYEVSGLVKYDDTKAVIALLRKGDSKFLDFLAASEDARKLFLRNVHSYLSKLDNIISLHKEDLNLTINESYFKGNLKQLLFTEQNNLNWWQATFLYAVTVFLGKPSTPRGIIDYFRVISNLIFNTTIDSPELYLQAIRRIDKIVGELDKEEDILHYLDKNSNDVIDFFSTTQKKEEKLKAQLCLDKISGEVWKKLLIDAEYHSYFYGQIGFILNICGEQLTTEQFEINFRKIAALFSDEVLDEGSYLLTRCFLSQGDCFYHVGNNGVNRTFNYNSQGTLRHRAENWRRFFEQKLDFIKKVIDHPIYDETNIIGSLNAIIKYETPNLKPGYYTKFVNNPKLFDYCKKNYIREYQGNYYLLNSTRLSGYFVELYTYNWFTKYKDRVNEFNLSELNISYHSVKGENNEPFIMITKDRMEWTVQKNFGPNGYKLSSPDGEADYKNIDAAINSIIQPSYT